MMLFVVFEWLATRRRRGARGALWTHAGLVVAGLVLSVIYAASWAAVGPWNLSSENFPGPPPGSVPEDFRARLEASR